LKNFLCLLSEVIKKLNKREILYNTIKQNIYILSSSNKTMGKRFNSFKRKFWFATMVLTFIASLGLTTGCPSPEPPPSQNKAPNTSVTTEIKENGEVKYNISGTDEDGSVDYISVNINGSHYGDFSNNYSFSVPIKEKLNTITATTVDNEGAEDPTPATGSFNSPTEYEASYLIEETLNPNTYNGLEKDVLISLGSSDSFRVNALINKKSDGTDAIIDYMGTHGDDLDLYGIPNICPNRTSTENLESQVETFQNNDYCDISKTRTANTGKYIIVPNTKTPRLDDYIIVPKNENN